jgi:L-asparaginase
MYMEKIKILVTGGTFDKEYDELTGALYFKETHVGEMLKLGRSDLDITVETLMLIDSLEMNDNHRSQLIETVKRASETRILITHGTDTLEVTARALSEAGLREKTIVLTGAMVPYKFGSSDGMFNLGSALAFVQALPPGVYAAMNGRAFLGSAVAKDKKTGKFGVSTAP